MIPKSLLDNLTHTTNLQYEHTTNLQYEHTTNLQPYTHHEPAFNSGGCGGLSLQFQVLFESISWCPRAWLAVTQQDQFWWARGMRCKRIWAGQCRLRSHLHALTHAHTQVARSSWALKMHELQADMAAKDKAFETVGEFPQLLCAHASISCHCFVHVHFC